MIGALAVLAAAAMAAPGCPRPSVSPGYTARVDHALRSGRDVWGEALLRSPGGPSYEGARRYLKPLLLAGREGRRSLTASGVYYVPIGGALHVADGSQILRGRARLTVRVGAERFGSCLARAGVPRLVAGWLPILQTSYVDGRGVRWRQESFTAGGVSYLHISGSGRVWLGSRAFAAPVYAAWDRRLRPLGRDAYERARRSVVAEWTARVAARTPFVVPERRVLDAERALLVQNLGLGWRYSVGNAYEELEIPEALDAAGVIGEYGFPDEERSILLRALRTPPRLYPNLELGSELAAAGAYERRTGDRGLRPLLRGHVARLSRALGRGRLLPRERYSSDLPDRVYGLNDQAVVWQGLRAMGATAPAARLGAGLRAAVRRSERRLPDGSLFVPVKLLGGERPYPALTATRDGSYWNLVMPYALASGLFAPGSREAVGILRYLELHGSWLLGLVRAGAYSLYGRSAPFPVSGTDQVYGIGVSRFLADNHETGRLLVSLYGQLAAGMTEGTLVEGEAASVAPIRGETYRRMYLPPNGTGNAAFLETLRLTLVHEVPNGLELAYSTPRAWLRPGRRIVVRDAPTAVGPVSFTLTAGRSSVHVSVDVPGRARTLRLRVRTPGRTRTLDLSGRRGHVELDVGADRPG